MMNSSDQHEAVLKAVQGSPLKGMALRLHAMKLLSQLEGWDWSGIYRLEGENLILDAYEGAATDHTVIPVGRGVCGTAVAEDRNQVIEDVLQLDNYLACSLSTRSEIVVLIRRDGVILGQIDIDGHQVGRFGSEEEEFLIKLSDLLAARWDE
jgi:L-methionine (R)-S-oxide reductase